MKSYKRHLYIAAAFTLFITAFVFSSINTGHSAPMSDRDVRVNQYNHRASADCCSRDNRRRR